MPEVKLTRKELKNRLQKFRLGVAIDFVNSLKRRCPVDKGTLRASIRYEVKGDNIIFYMNGIAYYVEFGTAPHLITAKSGGVLHWTKDGKDMFAKSVMHPGTEPVPFIRNVFHIDLPQIVKNNLKRYVFS